MLSGPAVAYALWASTGVGFAAAIVAWRARAEPGGVPLAAMFGGQVVWSVALLFQVRADGLASKVFWEEITWIGVVVIPVAWFVFAVEFTGHDRYITRRSVAALSVVPVATVGLALTSQTHDILYAETTLTSVRGQAFLSREPGVWLWVIAGYSYVLGAGGAVPLLGLVQRGVTVFRGQGVALLVGTLTPVASNLLYLGGFVPNPALDATLVAFCVSGVAFLLAVLWFRLFESSPAPCQHARQYLLDQSHDGFLVVDTHDTVVEINDAAGRIFATDTTTALGRPVSALGAESSIFRHDAEPPTDPFRGEHTDTTYDVSQTRLTNSRGRTVGTVYLFRDISQYIRTQQRHQVLNRLFRHNIRTQTSLIMGYADSATRGDTAQNLEKIRDSAAEIEDFSTETREILDIFDREYASPEPARLSAVLDEAIAETRARHPSVSVETEPVPADVYVDDSLESVFKQILSNAAEHVDRAEPAVSVSIDVDGDAVSTRFTDNGQGIDPYERSVLERGAEDPLEHGSGLGLWLVKWGAEVVGGDVEVTNSEAGATVGVSVPQLSNRAAVDGESSSISGEHGSTCDYY